MVVGGGASGVLVAARTLDASHARAVEVTIVDPGDRLAAGVAYGTTDAEHLLNVRASGMSADPSSPGDLVRWIGERGKGDADTFVPRRDYREYLEQHLAAAAATAPSGALEIAHDRVVALSVEDGACRVTLASGTELRADRVVLALGNSAPAVPDTLRPLDGHPAWVPDPWAPGALEQHAMAPHVLLVGSGLTMVDVAITLGRGRVGSDARSPLMALSRSGLLPLAHLERQPARPLDVIDLERDGTDVLALQARLRDRIVDRVGSEYPDEDWREVIDAVRPFANALWRRFDVDQQRLFLTEVMRSWDVHRHRMSPPTAARLDTLRTGGVLSTHTGRVLAVEPDSTGGVLAHVEVDGAEQHLRVDTIVNCTGPGRSWLPPANPVVADLVARGLAVPDVHGLGLSTTPNGQLVGADGRVVPEVLVIGPPRRGSLFETTAVPELRSQALHLADHMVIGDLFG